MEIAVKNGNAAKQQTQCLVLFTGTDSKQPAFKDVDAATDGLLSALIERGDLKQSPGQTLMVPAVTGIKAERVLLVSLGKEQPKAAAAEKICAAVARALNGAHIKNACIAFDDITLEDRDTSWLLRLLARSVAIAGYKFDVYKSNKKGDSETATLGTVTLLQTSRKSLENHKQAADEGAAIAAGMTLARDLGNQPGNVCTPMYLTEEAKKLARGVAKLTVKAQGEKEMEKTRHGFFPVGIQRIFGRRSVDPDGLQRWQ